ncbi:tRNA (adenosine(37)-N6)-threonylcarbamoyltransferase complex dimerization subunit type 1 TsaB [Jhaorihella thermophila]|uniref:tRNA threonylcarbamoyl adenosine modification protein YeaZ n=1 Tax=Jhaorihella thermophila TaxID=488547 RepID=A0A1H5S9Y8_9RHOB|nr:tRNA (adenosine(37)-N6)-threonylcarbamoyltransferase complex dimerization subunit type 1 TsaB [Jhaorihella thermophila]SEF47382.1 tRNA threonylcarbamoyl adenosine modification protein YeaZ [Jhaorihella thermophila]
MASDPLILAFDTSAAHCAAALLSGDHLLEARAEEMGRGQAERLMPMLQEMLARAGHDWRDLAAIGVGVGPGNFTGIRIAVSAARGLALGLGVPAVGVTGCAARLRLAAPDALPAIPAPRDQVYLCRAAREVELLPCAQAEAAAQAEGRILHTQADPARLAEAIARIAAENRQDITTPPAPFYVRPADAAPPRDAPPILLD